MAKKKLTIEDVLVPREEIPYEVPKNWCWVKLGSIVNLKSGISIKENQLNNEGEYLYVKVSDMNLDINTVNIEDSINRIDDIKTYEKNLIPANSIIFPKRGGAIATNKKRKVKFPIVVDTNTMAIIVPENINFDYIYLWFLSIDLWTLNSGSSIPQINNKDIEPLMIPLPPLAEQERIVKIVEKLFDKVDRAADLVDEASDDFEKRRASILSNAVRGNLTKEYRESIDKNIRPDNILELVLNKKQELIKAKKLKKDKNASDIKEKEILFEIPDSWEWVRLKDITINRDGERVPVSQADRNNREKIYDYYGASGVIDKIDNYIFDEELLLIGEDGANLVARSKPIAFIAQGKYWVNNHAHVLDSIDLNILKYIEIYINSIDLGPYISGSAQPKLTQANLNSIPIPLPSLEEQKQIVKVVNELLEKENEIESLTDINLHISNIKKSILAKAFRGELGSNYLNEESSIELLKKIIK